MDKKRKNEKEVKLKKRMKKRTGRLRKAKNWMRTEIQQASTNWMRTELQ